MENTETISIYDAIKEMKEISRKGGTFSFQAMSYNRSKQVTKGVIECSAAKLRKKPANSEGTVQDVLVHYLDDNGKPKHFYEPALMFFNGVKCLLL